MKRRTYRPEREFGLIVGAVLSLIAALVFTIAGATLIVLGAVLPRLLSVPRKWWMKLAEGMSYVSSRIILAIIFFLVLTPIGLIKRATGWDPLQRRSGTRETFWHAYPKRPPRHYERMF